MSDSIVRAGICGFTTSIHAAIDADGLVTLSIESDCPSVQRLAQALPAVDPLHEITYRGDMPAVLAAAQRALPHPACIVPSAIIKTVEVAAGLALPCSAEMCFAPPNEG